MTQNLEAAIAVARPRLDRLAAVYRLSRQDAEDLVQEVVLLALTRVGIRDLQAWLVAVFRRQALMFVRRRRQLDQRYPSIPEGFDVPERHDRPAELEAGLDAGTLLEQLPAAHAQVLRLKSQGYGVEEIAHLSGFQPSSIRQTYNRALHRLRREYCTDRLQYPRDLRHAPPRGTTETPRVVEPAAAALELLAGPTWSELEVLAAAARQELADVAQRLAADELGYSPL